MSFTLIEKRNLPDINSIGYLYEHQQTKAKVFYLENDDKNKTFSITFKTLPYDDNGIAHILEHSVLCGSKKYPTKEPFVELAKGSLNTFLNAMTFPDKTMYPISSMNDKDFNNLMDVYLDAVFFPNFKDNELILKQEGWHYHLENINDDLTYRGVVYNEMKGALSDPEQVLGRVALANLFPNTPYQFEYGGDPLFIPTLTQEKFIQFHNTYYHPSNCYTFLYGQLNIQEKLNHLDEYFNQFNYKDIDTEIPMQKPFEQLKTVETFYSIDNNETLQNKTYLSLEFVVGESKDIQRNLYLSLLAEILVGTNASPLRKKIFDANIASDVSSYVNRSTQQSSLDISLKNSEKEHALLFKNIVFDTLQNIVDNGIDDALFKATLNKFKFNLIESNQNTSYSKGVSFAQSTLRSWLYGGSPFDPFEYEQYIDQLENDPSLLKTLIKNVLLNNPHAILLIGSPKHNMNEMLYQQVHQQLQQYKKTLTTEQLNQIVLETSALLDYQNKADTDEDLEKLPLLSLQDIDSNIQMLNLEKTIVSDATLLHYEPLTSQINYIDFRFDLSHLTLKELQYASLISQLLKNVETEHYSLDDLTLQLNTYIGGITFNTQVQIANNCYPCLQIQGKAFNYQFTHLFGLLKEILCHSKFNDSKRIKEELLKIKTHFENFFVSSGHALAAYYVNGALDSDQKLESLISGIDFYQFITSLIDSFDTKFDEIKTHLTNTFTKLVSLTNLNILFIGSKEHLTMHLPLIETFIQPLEHYDTLQIMKNIELDHTPFGLTLATDTNYVVQGGKLKILSPEQFGQLSVLKNLLDFDYLWNNVRVKNGAYGGFSAIDRRGHVLLLSYRDPSIDNTLEVYKNIPHFIQNINLSHRELTKTIIGVFSNLDKPKSDRQLGNIAFERHLRTITDEQLQTERNAILSTTNEQLQNLAPLFTTILNQQKICVVGSQKELEKSQIILDYKNLIH